MSMFSNEEERAQQREGLAAIGFDGPHVMGIDPFGSQFAVCVGGGSLIEAGCGCPVILGDPMPNPLPQEGPEQIERGIFLHTSFHIHLASKEPTA